MRSFASRGFAPGACHVSFCCRPVAGSYRRGLDRRFCRASSDGPDFPGGLRPLFQLLDPIQDHAGGDRHSGPGGHDLSQSQSGRDRSQQDHGRAGGHRRSRRGDVQGPGSALPGGRKRAAGDPFADRRAKGQVGTRLQAGNRHRPGRAEHSGSRADERQSQGDRLSLAQLGTGNARRRWRRTACS